MAENDTIRSSGANTLVDVWIEGKMRGISVSRGAIEAYLGLPAERAAAMTEDDRCEFVRTHLAPIMKAAATRLRETGGAADAITIDAGQLGPGSGGDRRRSERRKGDRRKPEAAGRAPAHGDRRRGERRKTDRRARSKKES